MNPLFSTVDWAKGSNIYEVNIRQYTEEGSFAAFAAHLPRLKEMGVEILWLMPITPIAKKLRLGHLGSYYACSSYTAINPEFGTLKDFIDLVDQAHQLGFKLIIDWVANHTGWDHHWTFEHPDWYVKDEHGSFTEVNGWKDVIDLDFKSGSMRTAMIKAMQYWVKECGIDGFRCDMAHLVPLDFWIEARKACDQLKPLFWLAECDVPEYHQAFDASYAWNWMHQTEALSKGEASLQDIRNGLHAYSQYPHHAIKLFFTSNHDENSWNGTEMEKYGPLAKAWSVFAATWPGMPLIYSGQEIPNERRLLFFDKDRIDWDKPLNNAYFYHQLLHLRKSNQALQGGELFILPSQQDDALLAYMRKSGEDIILALLNLSPFSRLKIRVQHGWLQGRFKNLFTGLEFNFEPGEFFELRAGEYFVYSKV